MPASSLPPSRELWERAQRVRGEAAIACIRSWKLHLRASRLCKQGVFERPWAR